MSRGCGLRQPGAAGGPRASWASTSTSLCPCSCSPGPAPVSASPALLMCAMRTFGCSRLIVAVFVFHPALTVTGTACRTFFFLSETNSSSFSSSSSYTDYCVSFGTAEISQPGSGVIVVPAKRSPPTPPKRMTPVTKRHSGDPPPPSQTPESPTTDPTSAPVTAPSSVRKEEGSDDTATVGVPPPISDPVSLPPSHIPPSPPRVHALKLPSNPSSGMVPTVQTDPPSPTTEPPSQPPAVPLHILIQRALASPGPVQPNPDGSQRAHSLLFESPPEVLLERGVNTRHSLPITIEPIRL